MPPVFRPVTPSFLATLRACAWESPERLTLATEPPTSLRVCVGESGAWALGKDPREPRTMSSGVFDQVRAARANDDGTLDFGGGWMVALLDDVDTGAALPGEIPDPPPPPPR